MSERESLKTQELESYRPIIKALDKLVQESILDPLNIVQRWEGVDVRGRPRSDPVFVLEKEQVESLKVDQKVLGSIPVLETDEDQTKAVQLGRVFRTEDSLVIPAVAASRILADRDSPFVLAQRWQNPQLGLKLLSFYRALRRRNGKRRN